MIAREFCYIRDNYYLCAQKVVIMCMKKIFTILLLYFVCISNSILITSCAEEDVTGYYSVSFYQADSANNLHKYIVKQTTSYDSDSLAVVRETQLFHKLQDMGQMEIEKAGGKDKSSVVS